jgi:hypothetical protein
MHQIHVLVTAMPAFLGGIVKRILDEQDDIAIVSGDATDCSLDEMVVNAGANVVIIGSSDAAMRRDGWLGLVWVHPRLRILALDDSGRRSSAIEIRLRSTAGKAWPAALVDVVRNAGEAG